MELLAWPAVALILGLVGIFAFKKPLERLIDRTQKVGKAGLEAGSAIQPAAEQQPLSKADELLAGFDNALLLKREAKSEAGLMMPSCPQAAIESESSSGISPVSFW